MTMFALADRLHKTVTEIEALPAAEFVEWLAYFRLTEKSS